MVAIRFDFNIEGIVPRQVFLIQLEEAKNEVETPFCLTARLRRC
jgi:hypothetical protein